MNTNMKTKFKLKLNALCLAALMAGAGMLGSGAAHATDVNKIKVRGRLWKVVEHKLSNGTVWQVDVGVYSKSPGTTYVSPVAVCADSACAQEAVDLIDLFTCSAISESASDPAEPGGTTVTHRCSTFSPSSGPCIEMLGWLDSGNIPRADTTESIAATLCSAE